MESVSKINEAFLQKLNFLFILYPMPDECQGCAETSLLGLRFLTSVRGVQKLACWVSDS